MNYGFIFIIIFFIFDIFINTCVYMYKYYLNRYIYLL